LVFEYVEKNLLEVLEEKPAGLDPQTVKLFIYQLVKAIAFCHNSNVIHRDIKPENLLIDPDAMRKEGNGVNTLKLCDFGFARFMPAVPKEVRRPAPLSRWCALTCYRRRVDCPVTAQATHHRHPHAQDSYGWIGHVQGALTDYVSTRWYRAPELLLGSTVYGFEVDQWAIGCIMGELIDGQPLFPGESDIDQLYIIQRQLGGLTQSQMDMFLRNPRFAGLKFPDMSRPETIEAKYGNKLTGHALSFMKALLRIDPAERLTGVDCLSHPYFDGVHDPHPLRFPAAGGAALGRSHTPTAAAAAPKVEKRTSRVAAKPVPPPPDPEEQERLRREQRRRENEARLLRERNEVRLFHLPGLNHHMHRLDSPRLGGVVLELSF
jgi:cyclin-dependent kinase-like